MKTQAACQAKRSAKLRTLVRSIGSPNQGRRPQSSAAAKLEEMLAMTTGRRCFSLAVLTTALS